MSIAIIFGLSFTTVLTLVVVPSLYVMLGRLAARVRRRPMTAPATVPKAEPA